MTLRCITFCAIALCMVTADVRVHGQGPPEPELVREMYEKSRAEALKAGAQPRRKKKTVRRSGSVGLGLSIYKREPDGSAVTTDPSQVFRQGDKIRFVVEPTSDGYFYVFVSTNGGPAKMAFPDPRLDRGQNRVLAHCLYEIPSRLEATDERRWLSFFGESGTERVFLVFSRQPLAGVPIGAQLDRHARSGGHMPLVLTDKQSAKISGYTENSVDARATAFGQRLPKEVVSSTVRDLGVPPDAPEPSVIRFARSRSASALTAIVDLTHKKSESAGQ